MIGTRLGDTSSMARGGATRLRRVLAGATVVVLLAGGSVACRGYEQPAPVALVYRGPATGCDECSKAVAHLLRSSDHGFDVAYIGPGQEIELTSEALDGAALYAHPGGNLSVDAALDRLGEDAPDVIVSYVQDGGRYLGFCLGAYLAGSKPGLGLLAPGDTDRYSATSGSDLAGSEEGVVRVEWGSGTRWHYAQDPPVLLPSEVDGERILSRFSNGEVNALVRRYGDGMAGAVGTHPEAGRDWYTDALWRADRDGLDAQDGLDLIDAVMTPGESGP